MHTLGVGPVSKSRSGFHIRKRRTDCGNVLGTRAPGDPCSMDTALLRKSLGSQAPYELQSIMDRRAILRVHMGLYAWTTLFLLA